MDFSTPRQLQPSKFFKGTTKTNFSAHRETCLLCPAAATKTKFTVQQKCHKVTSRPPLAWNQLGISLSAAEVFASDRYVFVLLGSVWCRECPRRALKSTIQDPKCQSTSPQPFRATKPSDSTKMASLAFFFFFFSRALQSASYKWPHSTPVRHLTGLWILLPERPDAKKYTLHCRGVGVHSVSAFRLCMNNLNGFQLDGKFSFGCQRELKKRLGWKW